MNGRPSRRNKAAFSNSPILKNVFEKLPFSEGLVSLEGLSGKIKPRFQILPAQFGRDFILRLVSSTCYFRKFNI